MSEVVGRVLVAGGDTKSNDGNGNVVFLGEGAEPQEGGNGGTI